MRFVYQGMPNGKIPDRIQVRVFSELGSKRRELGELSLSEVEWGCLCENSNQVEDLRGRPRKTACPLGDNELDF